MNFLIYVNIALLCAFIFVLQRLFWYRSRLHRGKRLTKKHFIAKVPPEKFDSKFSIQDFGYTRDCEVHFIGRSIDLPGETSDREGFILSVFAKSAKSIFEFGTCSGKTSYLLARNSPEEAIITIITLGPDQLNMYSGMQQIDNSDASESALSESIFKRFVYSGSEVESKIVQLFNDSKCFNEKDYIGKCDIIFIDGSHAYSYVKSDTEKALKMISEGGVILWHDYGSNSGAVEGVTKYLHELSKQLKLFWIEDTSLIAYRHSKL